MFFSNLKKKILKRNYITFPNLEKKIVSEKYTSTVVFEFSITPLPYVRSLRKLQHMMAHGARITIIMKKKIEQSFAICGTFIKKKYPRKLRRNL